MYLALLNDSKLYEFLLQIDRDLAETARQSACRFCGDRLHSACYLRKPRGVPEDIDPGPEYPVRFSFCCRAEACRRRHTPPSVRFLGRRVYLGVMVVLLTVMRQGPTPRSVESLQAIFGVGPRTLVRWQTWWHDIFPKSGFWRRVKARFMPAVAEADLPGALVLRFQGETLLQRIILLLTFLSPSSQAL